MVSMEKSSWVAAQKSCTDLDGFLFEPRTPEDDKVLDSLFSGNEIGNIGKFGKARNLENGTMEDRIGGFVSGWIGVRSEGQQ